MMVSIRTHCANHRSRMIRYEAESANHIDPSLIKGMVVDGLHYYLLDATDCVSLSSEKNLIDLLRLERLLLLPLDGWDELIEINACGPKIRNNLLLVLAARTSVVFLFISSLLFSFLFVTEKDITS